MRARTSRCSSCRPVRHRQSSGGATGLAFVSALIVLYLVFQVGILSAV